MTLLIKHHLLHQSIAKQNLTKSPSHPNLIVSFFKVNTKHDREPPILVPVVSSCRSFLYASLYTPSSFALTYHSSAFSADPSLSFLSFFKKIVLFIIHPFPLSIVLFSLYICQWYIDRLHGPGLFETIWYFLIALSCYEPGSASRVFEASNFCSIRFHKFPKLSDHFRAPRSIPSIPSSPSLSDHPNTYCTPTTFFRVPFHISILC
jgi:hypothetical protein